MRLSGVRDFSRRCHRLILFCAAFSLSNTQAQAQLVLHSAPAQESNSAQGFPSGSRGGDGQPLGPHRLKPVPVSPPGEESIIDRELLHEGSKGVIGFQRGPDKTLLITKLVMEGEQISSPAEACRVDVNPGEPIPVRPASQAGGLAHFSVDLAACPFSFNLMNGAIFVSPDTEACTFQAADCKIDLSGLWGPDGSSFSEKQIKAMEHSRASAEVTMRTNYRALQSLAGKDRAQVKKNAHDQAGFSSEREVICRNYAHEDQHGFCALQITLSRALGLATEYNEKAEAKAEAKTTKRSGAIGTAKKRDNTETAE